MVVNGILLLLVLFWQGQRAQDGLTLDAVERTLASALEAQVDRLERNLRHEVSHSARDNRQEQTQAMAAFQRALMQQGAETTRTQNAQLDAFAQQLAQLRGGLSEALSDQMLTLRESNEARLGEVRRTLEQQLAQLQAGNAAKLEEMRQTVDEKLHATLEQRLGANITVHADDEQGGAFLDVDGLLGSVAAVDRVYLCGPKPMLDGALASAKARQWEAGRLHFELFTVAEPEAGDHAFEVELAQSGVTLTVPANQSILDCLIEHGYDPLYDCKRGECGVCTLPVLEGEIDHRDYVLTDSEKASGKMMQVCVSRAKGNKLVLDF